MTITKRVQKELVQAVAPDDTQALQTLRKNTRALRAAHKARSAAEKNKGKAWTREEHERFLVALDVFPSGPWKAIADYVGTKDSRQTMTHAQKYRQKHERAQRGLRNKNKSAKKPATIAATKTQDINTRKPEALDVSMAEVEVKDFSVFPVPPQAPTLVKQLSDSPRSADDGASATNTDPFAALRGDDSLFTLSLDASAAWLGANKTDSDLMEIFADYNEPATETVWPQMWSTNSLEEIVASCSQFDFLGEDVRSTSQRYPPLRPASSAHTHNLIRHKQVS